LTRPYKIVGKYTTLEERQAGGDTIGEWNRIATLFQVEVEPNADKLGAPGNGTNELNILISSADTQSIYGFAMDGNLYGRGVMEPSANFGNFNECKDFSSAGCGPYTQTDVVMNAGFSHNWTADWYQDGGGQNPALIQTTAIHEVGHTLGFHHVFELPALGDSFSTMNYANDDSMKWATRMDAKTLRQEYSTRVNNFTDVAIYPFIYGNAQYGETYASLSATSVAQGGSVNLQNWLIQNVGTTAASNVVVTFYLVPVGTRAYPQPTDTAIGTATFANVAADSEADQASTPLLIPQGVANGQYNLGAIVTVGGAEDTPFVAGKYPGNNRFLIGHGTKTILTVGGGSGCRGAVPFPDDLLSGEDAAIATALRIEDDCQGATPLSNGIGFQDTVVYPYANYYCFQVPAGATSLTITTVCSDDIDLYVKLGALPTYIDYDCASDGQTGNETCSGSNPTAGLYFIAVDGAYIWNLSASYTITASYTGGATCSLSCTASAPPSGTVGTPVCFTSTVTATACSGSPAFSWTFGDGGTSNLQNPEHTYASAGTYNITYSVTQGGQTCSKGGSVTITGGATCTLDCTAAAPGSGTAGVPVSFSSTVTATGCSGSPSFSWNFGDGGTSTQQNPSHTYAAAGVYNLSFSVTQDGKTCSKTGSITITGGATCTLACTATVPATGTAGSTVSFSSTATPSNCTGTPTYSWVFGDGGTSAQQNPSHTYAAAGTFNWSLTVTVDNQTCPKSGSITISGGGNPSTLAIGTATGSAGANVCVDIILTNSGTPVITAFTTDLTYDSTKLTPMGVTTPAPGKLIGGNIVTAGTYRITLYGGTGTLSNGPVANVCFNTTAGQCATYTLAHAAGTPSASDAAANAVAVTGTSGSLTTTGCGTCSVACTASASPTSGGAPLNVSFTSTATPSNCTGSPTYAWTFGDGQTSTSQNPSHTYQGAGTYNWSLTVSVDGQTCSKSGSITATGGGGGRTIAIGARSGAAGSNLCVDITLDNGGAAAVITAFTTDLTYDASKLTPTGVTTTAPGKLIGGNIVTAGTYRITLYGGTGTLANGTVATVCFDTTAGQCATYTLSHAVGSPTASDASANNVTVSGTSGAITTTGCAAGRTFAIGTKSGTAGSNLCVDMTLDNGGAAAVITAFTTDVTYDASKLTPTGVTTTAPGKLIGGNIVTAGTYRITLYGGTGTLSNGTVATVCFDTTAGQCATYPIAHAAGSPTASDAAANAVTVTGTPGSITAAGCGGTKPGDCDGNDTVSIGEVQKAINMFLGTLATGCGVDCNANGAVSIGEVQKVINGFLGLPSSC
jgi:PKD repeat protein